MIFSKTLNKFKLKHSAIEKEAAAIIEAVQKWKHYRYLTGQRFPLITDQESVSYMLKHSGKIKKR